MEYEINSLKEKIFDLIKDTKEVTSKTDYKYGGVYLLYINNFDNDKILPIYIGQTDDFQTRHKTHITEIMTLNRFTYDYYRAAIFENEFSGYYKSCKFFKYLIENECNIQDIKMLIIEESDVEDERRKLEFDYINNYCAAYFGFNQLNSITLNEDQKANGLFAKEFTSIVESDISNLIKYQDYGFNDFNCMLAKGIFEKYNPKGLEQLYKIKVFKDILDKKDKMGILNEEYYEYKRYVNRFSIEECKNVCKNIIDNYFRKNNLKSEEKKKQIIEYLVYQKEKTKIEIDRYIKRFNKNQNEDIFSILSKKKGTEITKITNKISFCIDEMNKIDDNILELLLVIFDKIIPKKEYTSFPLKDTYKEKEFETSNENNENNVLYINIEFSNHGRKTRSDDYPDILKVDYRYVNNNKIEEKNYFISSVFDNFFERNYFYIIYKSMYKFNEQSPFNIGKYNSNSKYANYSTISTSMEYYNGINEFTLLDKTKIHFKDVVFEIDALINENTKIIYTSGCKSLVKRFSEYEIFENSILINKLVKLVR